jgi:predicted  nucleic acid-binding Zn-ribbon protein
VQPKPGVRSWAGSPAREEWVRRTLTHEAQSTDVVGALRCLVEVDGEIRASQERDRHVERALEDIRCRLDELSLALEARKSKNRQEAIIDMSVRVDEMRYRELLDEFEHRTEVARARRAVGQRERRMFDSLRRRALMSIPPDIASVYEALIDKDQIPALVDLVNRRCGGCGETLGDKPHSAEPATLGVLQCPHCHRLLALASRSRPTHGVYWADHG